VTKEQIAELRMLDAEATPVPWTAIMEPLGPIGGRRIESPHDDYTVFATYDDSQLEGASPADVPLAAAARNALPRLLDEREALLAAAWAARLAHTVQQQNEAHAALEAAIAKAESP
jgi:hypothetical protein